MCELEASNNTERSNKIETLVDMETQQADNAPIFTPAQKSVQLTGPRSRRAQEMSLSFAFIYLQVIMTYNILN